MKSRLKSVLLDVLAGFLAFCLLGLGIASIKIIAFDLRVFFSVTAVLSLLAGFIRGKSAPQNPWLKGLLVSSGSSLPCLVLALTGQAFGLNAILGLLLLLSSLLAIAGVQARRFSVAESRKKAALLLSLPWAATVLASVTLVPPLMSRLANHYLDKPAPSFSFSTLDGRTIHSSELKGRVVVLAFWATWCPPCLRELPKLQRAYALYKTNPAVAFWAIDANRGGDTAEKARAFVGKQQLDLPFAYDSQGAASNFGFEGLPALIILDPRGHIRLIHSGYDESENLAREISRDIEALLIERK